MRTPSGTLLSLAIVILLTSISALGQEQVASISQLKEQLAMLEAIDRNPSTTYEVRSINRNILAERRTQLRTLLVKRIDALRKYQAALSASLTPDEAKTIEVSISNLEADLRRLETTPQSTTASDASALSTAPVNLIASTDPAAIPIINTSSVRAADSLAAYEARPAVSGASAVKCTITITSDTAGKVYNLPNVTSTVDVDAVVSPANCTTNLQATVINNKSLVDQRVVAVGGGGGVHFAALMLASGSNVITISDTKELDVHADITFCRGECAKPAKAATENVASNDLPDAFSSMYSRAGVGFEQAGAAAANSTQKFMLEFFWNPPLVTSRKCPTELSRRPEGCRNGETRFADVITPPVSAWGNVRFASIPQQLSDPLSTFSNNFLNPISSAKVNELVQGFDFLAGLEFSFNRGTEAFVIGGVKQRVTVSFIIGGGAINPLTPKASAQIFEINDAVTARFGAARTAGKKYIAFVSPDVDRFTRQYYAGIRLKTHYYRDDGFTPLNRPPAILDATVGQNELVTGGRLHGMVLRLDGFYPLPFNGASFIYLYGTANLKLSRKPNFTDPLILATAPSTVTIPNPDVLIVTSDPSNRDFYRIGVGVNIFDLINKVRSSAKAQAGTP